MKYKNYLYSQNTEWRSWLDLGVQDLCLACKIQSSRQWQTENKKKQSFNIITPQIDRNRLKDTLPAWHFCLVWPPRTECWGLAPLHSDGPLHSASSLLYQPEIFGPSYWPPGKKKKKTDQKECLTLAFKVKMNVSVDLLCSGGLTPCFPGLPLFFLPFPSPESSSSLTLMLRLMVSPCPSFDESLHRVMQMFINPCMQMFIIQFKVFYLLQYRKFWVDHVESSDKTRGI